MSDIGINYDARTDPSQVAVQFQLGVSGTSVRATVQSVQACVITLTPAGNLAVVVISSVAWPLAQTLGAALPPLVATHLQGLTFDLLSLSGSTVDLAGEAVTVAPSDLQLSNRNGMLLVQGTIRISSALDLGEESELP